MSAFPNVSTLTLADAAHDLAADGFHIFPVEPNGKAPLSCKTCGLANGKNHATTDLVSISKWWTHHATASIGCVPALSGFIVVDIDTADQARAFEELLAAGNGSGLPEHLEDQDCSW
jgi:hypothetical protein